MKTVPSPGLFEGIIKGGNGTYKEELNLDAPWPEDSCLLLSSALLTNWLRLNVGIWVGRTEVRVLTAKLYVK